MLGFSRKDGYRELFQNVVVRVQHQMLDDSAIEGVWVGTYGDYLHLRAAKVVKGKENLAFRTDEILVPRSQVIFMEILARDAS